MSGTLITFNILVVSLRHPYRKCFVLIFLSPSLVKVGHSISNAYKSILERALIISSGRVVDMLPRAVITLKKSLKSCRSRRFEA